MKVRSWIFDSVLCADCTKSDVARGHRPSYAITGTPHCHSSLPPRACIPPILICVCFNLRHYHDAFTSTVILLRYFAGHKSFIPLSRLFWNEIIRIVATTDLFSNCRYVVQFFTPLSISHGVLTIQRSGAFSFYILEHAIIPNQASLALRLPPVIRGRIINSADQSCVELPVFSKPFLTVPSFRNRTSLPPQLHDRLTTPTTFRATVLCVLPLLLLDPYIAPDTGRQANTYLIS